MSSGSNSGARILTILDLFTEAQPDWMPEAIMARLGYSRPTLYRYLKTLKSMGYLVSTPGDALTLGPRVTELDFLMRRSDPLITAGAPLLKILAARHPCAVFITRWYGRKTLCIASEVSTARTRSSYPRGRPMPLTKGAVSRVILAFLPRRDQEALMADHLHEMADPGVTPEALMADFRKIRRDGICTAWAEITPGVVGVAAPILAGPRAPVGALCLTSLAKDMDDDRLAMIRRDVKDSVAAVAGILTARTVPPPSAPASRPSQAAPLQPRTFRRSMP